MERIIEYRDALREAIRGEMRRDPGVFVLGLGVARRGGSFGVTKGLMEEFGPLRVIDTPISEASFTGMAIGAAMQGKRPIAEIIFVDFATLGLDMMINQAAKYHFVTGGGGAVPMVLRTQGGAGTGLSIQHSQSLEALFYHIPGLKLAMPSTPYDAKGLLTSAIRDDHPVAFIEHKLLYGEKGPVPEEEYAIPFGQAALRREGSDCTIIAWSRMALLAEQAADTLAAEGISCDVLDLRTLVPMDRAAILASVRKTDRLVIAAEAVKRGSVASDIAAFAAEEAFDALKAPIARVAGKVTPVPYNAKIEQAVIPHAGDIVAAVKRMLNCEDS